MKIAILYFVLMIPFFIAGISGWLAYSTNDFLMRRFYASIALIALILAMKIFVNKSTNHETNQYF
jgi:hypothetical protein